MPEVGRFYKLCLCLSLSSSNEYKLEVRPSKVRDKGRSCLGDTLVTVAVPDMKLESESCNKESLCLNVCCNYKVQK